MKSGKRKRHLRSSGFLLLLLISIPAGLAAQESGKRDGEEFDGLWNVERSHLNRSRNSRRCKAERFCLHSTGRLVTQAQEQRTASTCRHPILSVRIGAQHYPMMGVLWRFSTVRRTDDAAFRFTTSVQANSGRCSICPMLRRHYCGRGTMPTSGLATHILIPLESGQFQ